MNSIDYSDRLMASVASSLALTVCATVAAYTAVQSLPTLERAGLWGTVLLAVAGAVLLNLLVPPLFRWMRRSSNLLTAAVPTDAVWKGRCIGLVLGLWLGFTAAPWLQ